MKSNTTLTLILIAALTILIAGCIDNNDPVVISTPELTNITPLDTPTIAPTVVSTPKPIPTITPTPKESLTPIESLLNDIIRDDPANKNHYNITGNRSQMHTGGMMAIEQCQYITDNYNYSTGIVLLEATQGNSGEGQTWVIINDSKYIIDSINDNYWTEEEHHDIFRSNYKILFVPLKKGIEIIRVSADYYCGTYTNQR